MRRVPRRVHARATAELHGEFSAFCEERGAGMAGIAARVQASPGTVTAADLIERLARDGNPVVR